MERGRGLVCVIIKMQGEYDHLRVEPWVILDRLKALLHFGFDSIFMESDIV